MKCLNLILLASTLFAISACTVIRPGEAGVRQKFGRLKGDVITSGVVLFNPFVSRVVKTSIQTKNLELSITLPSKEGLSITSQISILYRVDQKKLPLIIANLGLNFEPIIANVFRSASADVCAQYYAKDMHSGMRAKN